MLELTRWTAYTTHYIQASILCRMCGYTQAAPACSIIPLMPAPLLNLATVGSGRHTWRSDKSQLKATSNPR